MKNFYATFAESLVYADHYEIAVFNSEQKRDDWLNYKDEISLNINGMAENHMFTRIALKGSIVNKLIKHDMPYISDNEIEDMVWIRC